MALLGGAAMMLVWLVGVGGGSRVGSLGGALRGVMVVGWLLALLGAGRRHRAGAMMMNAWMRYGMTAGRGRGLGEGSAFSTR